MHFTCLLRGCELNISRRREVANYRLSHRTRLSSDAKVIIALMKDQPQKLNDLCRNAGIHPSTFYRIRPLLINMEILKETVRGYTLRFYSELDEKVEKALREYKDTGYEQVGLNDLANKVGESPKVIEEITYRLAPKYGLEIGLESRRKEPQGTLLRA